MPQSVEFNLGSRLYPYCEDGTWRFPKHKRLPVIRHTIGYINDFFSKQGQWPTIEIFNKNINDYLRRFPEVLRREKSKSLDSSYIKLAEAIFLGVCSLTNSQENIQRFIFPSKLGLLFCDVYDNCEGYSVKREENEFLSFLCFLMLKQASFSSGSTENSSSIDKIHPYEIIFNYFRNGATITSEDLCEKFYGDDPAIDFLDPSRASRMASTKKEKAIAYWEYFVGHGCIFQLFKFVDSSGKKADRKHLRYYQTHLYIKDLILAPTPLLLSFLNPDQSAYWTAVYEARVATLESDAYAFSYDQSSSFADKKGSLLDTTSDPLKKITRLVTARNGQKTFRSGVLSEWGKKCLVCGISTQVLLEAAHIVPHHLCKTQQEASDPGNGVTLCKNHHKAYDEGLLLLTLSHSDGNELKLSCVSNKDVADFAFTSTLNNGIITLPNSGSIKYFKKRKVLFKK